MRAVSAEVVIIKVSSHADFSRYKYLPSALTQTQHSQLHNMSDSWVPPPRGITNINVHCLFRDDPLENGNQNAVGMVARDSDGVYL